MQKDTGHLEANKIPVINRKMEVNLLCFVDKKELSSLKDLFFCFNYMDVCACV